MRFRQQLLWTLVIQGSGAAALLGAVVLLGSRLGPEAQGLFSRIKSELEFVTALSLFGMPQALFYFVSVGRMRANMALRWSAGLGALCIAIALAYLALNREVDGTYALSFALSCAAIVTHGVLRTLTLARASTLRFNVITALPQLCLLGFAVWSVSHGTLASTSVALAFLLAYGLSLSVALAGLLSSAHDEATLEGPLASSKELLSYGTAAWAAAGLSTAVVVLWLRQTETLHGLKAVGLFSMGLTMVQIVVTPANYASPLLFKRWVGAKSNGAALKPALVAGLGSLVLVGTALTLKGWLPSDVLGPYATLLDLGWAFGIAASAEVMQRIAAVGTNASGRPWAPVLSELVRSLCLVAAMVLGLTRSLHSMAWVWTLGAALSAGSMVYSVSLTPKGAP